ncbi:hypothetical protein [Cupriavidus gilardii]|uniref:hypothetical protein n=1 Tax=Cupriavidus gilardii TaxID=82541 RepID=UPI0009ED12CF|nr:hypothetical protein [Cupriavidus gilardii]
MTRSRMTAEQAFAEARGCLAEGAGRGEGWRDRMVFWTAVRFGLDDIRATTWRGASGRWSRLWEIVQHEHLPPIPGVPEVEQQLATATVAERNIAQMRAMVGGRQKR